MVTVIQNNTKPKQEQLNFILNMRRVILNKNPTSLWGRQNPVPLKFDLIAGEGGIFGRIFELR